MQLSVVVVNYNVKYFLEHCLLSVQKACRGIDAEIIVTDNHSADGSREYLEPKFPNVIFIWNGRNGGFGAASNIGMKAAKGEYVLFLNPDTIVPKDCFARCLQYFQQHKKCGALGVRMIDGSGKFLRESKRSLPGLRNSFFKMTGLAALFSESKICAGYYAGHLAEEENKETQVLAGAFMMLNRQAIDATKGFDESFFMYGEDVDLSYRILQAGMQNHYFGEMTIIHFKGESTQKRSAAYYKNFYGAMALFVKKHYSFPRKQLSLAGIKIMQGFKSRNATDNSTARASQFPDKSPVAVTEKPKRKILLIADNEHDATAARQITKSDSSVSILACIVSQEMLSEIGKSVMSESQGLLFCGGELSNKTIIRMLEQVPGEKLALIHQSGAQSIIGSNDKDSNGFVIAAS